MLRDESVVVWIESRCQGLKFIVSRDTPERESLPVCNN